MRGEDLLLDGLWWGGLARSSRVRLSLLRLSCNGDSSSLGTAPFAFCLTHETDGLLYLVLHDGVCKHLSSDAQDRSVRLRCRGHYGEVRVRQEVLEVSLEPEKEVLR